MITTMNNALSLRGKNVLITGGNRGIGKGIAQAMVQCGANIAIMARDEKKAHDTLEELTAMGGAHRFYRGDVTDYEGARNVVHSMVKDYGKIDVLVNNSGIARIGAVLDMDESLQDWFDTINVNLNGVLYMSYLAGNFMKKAGSGNIINISSNAGQIVNLPIPHAAYSVAKAGVDRLTKCLAVELGNHNIRVNAIAPGYTYSDLIMDGAAFDELYNQWKAMTPTGRFGQPIEVGALAVFLASEASAQITGTVMVIDGGYMLAR